MMLFSGLEESDFDLLLEPIDNLRYPVKCDFYAQGEQGETVYSIRRGLVKLTQTLPDGTQRIVRLLGPGALVGLESLLDEPYRHSVSALQEVEVCRISTATLQQLEQEKLWLSQKLMQHWERHLEYADRWISELSSGSARARTLRLLALLLEMIGDEEGRLQLFGYEDMAAIIGATRETFSRMVGELRDEGVIQATEDSQLVRVVLPDS